MGLDVRRPARMGSGSYMTVGTIGLNRWMIQTANGLLDFPATLAALRDAASALDQALE